MSEQTLRASAGILFESISGLKVRPRFCRAEGPSGLHRSPQRGETVEFSEYKPYSPGVELKFLDWKLFARTDRLYTKSFCDERASRFLIVCDDSPSMVYPPDGATKLQMAAELALGLAFIAGHRQKDAVQVMRLSKSGAPQESVIQPLGVVLLELQRMLDSPPADVPSSIESLARIDPRHPTTIIVLSDLYELPDDVLKWSLRMRRRGHECWFLQTMSKEEIALPYENLRNFVDVETGQKLQLDPSSIRAHYSRALHEHIAGLKRLAAHGRYGLAITGNDPSAVLKRFLSD